MPASVGPPASFGPRSSSVSACFSIACASARYFRSCSPRSAGSSSRSDASTARSKVASSRSIIRRSSPPIRSAASTTPRSPARSATPARRSYDESSSASYESAWECSLPGVSGWRRAKRRKPLRPTFITTSFVSEGFALRASRSSRTSRSCPSVSRRCSRYAAESSGSPAISGAVRSWASACSSIECASVRYFVSCSLISVMGAPYPSSDSRHLGGRIRRVLALVRLVLVSHLSGGGVSVALPAGWDGRVSLIHNQTTLRASNGDLDLELAELGNRPGTSGFLPVRRLVLRPQDLRTPQLAIRRVAVHGRSFLITADLPDATLLGTVNDVLAQVRIAWPAGLAPAARRRLERRFGFRACAA